MRVVEILISQNKSITESLRRWRLSVGDYMVREVEDKMLWLS